MGRVPEHWRRALRLFLGVGLPCLVGYGVVGPEHMSYSKNFALACKWSAITAVVVSSPLIGKSAQVGFERSLGTIVGGLLAVAVHGVGSVFWNEATDGIFLSFAAALTAASAVLIGNALKLDVSARLFVITFLLVTFGAQSGADAHVVALTRSAGIVSGVLISLLLSILVLPKSASSEAMHTLRKALKALAQLNSLAWSEHLPHSPPPSAAGTLPGPPAATAAAVSAAGARPYPSGAPLSNGGSGATNGSSSMRRTQGSGGAALSWAQRLLQRGALRRWGVPAGAGYEALPGSDPEAPAPPAQHAAGGAQGSSSAVVAAEEGFEEECEKAMTEVYQLLFKVGDLLEVARAEVLVSTCRGHPFFLPGFPIFGCSDNHMPLEELRATAFAARRVARLLATLITTLQGGFERQLQDSLRGQFPERLLPELAATAQAALQELYAGFAAHTPASGAGLAAFAAAVRGMVEDTDQQRRRMISALTRYKRGKAYGSWSQLVSAVQQMSRGGGSLHAGHDMLIPEPAPAPEAPMMVAVSAPADFLLQRPLPNLGGRLQQQQQQQLPANGGIAQGGIPLLPQPLPLPQPYQQQPADHAAASPQGLATAAPTPLLVPPPLYPGATSGAAAASGAVAAGAAGVAGEDGDVLPPGLRPSSPPTTILLSREQQAARVGQHREAEQQRWKRVPSESLIFPMSLSLRDHSFKPPGPTSGLKLAQVAEGVGLQQAGPSVAHMGEPPAPKEAVAVRAPTPQQQQPQEGSSSSSGGLAGIGIGIGSPRLRGSLLGGPGGVGGGGSSGGSATSSGLPSPRVEGGPSPFKAAAQAALACARPGLASVAGGPISLPPGLPRTPQPSPLGRPPLGPAEGQPLQPQHAQQQEQQHAWEAAAEQGTAATTAPHLSALQALLVTPEQQQAGQGSSSPPPPLPFGSTLNTEQHAQQFGGASTRPDSSSSMRPEGGLIFPAGTFVRQDSLTPLVLFPDSAEGRVAQVAYTSFQFLCCELAEELAELHAVVGRLMRRLPK